MPSSTVSASAHDMSHMNGADSGYSHSMDGMQMSMSMGTFHWGWSGDGIWLDAWVPQSEGAYIGACFGLFFVAILSRTLPALEAYFIAWKRLRENRGACNRLSSPSRTIRTDIEKSPNPQDDCSSGSFKRSAYPNPLQLPEVLPFSWSMDTVRSFISTLNSFVGYLLMMVVMTGNGGFFLVIVLGIFVGELAFGRFKSLGGGLIDDHSH
ncbi:Ctr copper transporter family-domain-containing protein [Mycotypha africana]|uniref:Ctr copper transporter family-domain-containing protein n=1 Tax=Mycotypha africana TaxID=64632 RepID=UPI0023006CC7|nr:Ctr copper transporter family-domain-containing protein [Mycotypha africana]KAI8975670.1 Ctr copper transporter family-domain-containing protein [Mycotypha africana]